MQEAAAEALRNMLQEAFQQTVADAFPVNRAALRELMQKEIEAQRAEPKTAKPPLQSEGYLLQFAATFVPTILIELVVLLLFGFKLKENWKPFLLVNLVTQGLLHGYFALFAVNNGVGPWYFMLFIPAELVIALLEAFIYRAALKGRSKRRAFLCGLCANVCSAALGYFLAEPVWRFVVSIS